MDNRENGTFVSIYQANYSDVLRYVQRRVPAAHVDDIVAETFLVAWRRNTELPAEPRAWLFRTAANILRSTARREARQVELAVRSFLPPAVPADKDAAMDVAAAWRCLSPNDREVIALHGWENLTDAEAAEVLGCSRSAYAMRLTRAKRRLAKQLTKSESTDAASVDDYARVVEGTS
jgi:RNA polymerase sigma factor (sigma-70 family)